jgi:1-deoxy-D-xylulose-5-phosphate synthase
LPVVFLMDRAGLTGPDGPTHHGLFDVGYLRVLPNIVVMAPGDGPEIAAMLDFALGQDHPCSLRYPKATAATVDRQRAPVQLGRAEILSWGADAAIVSCGTQLADCVAAAQVLREEGWDVGVINARFVKPIDKDVMLRALRECSAVVTVEEAALAGGFGSAVAELAADEGVSATHLCRLGMPDRFIEHGERAELLADLGLDANGIAKAVRERVGQLQA